MYIDKVKKIIRDLDLSNFAQEEQEMAVEPVQKLQMYFVMMKMT